ncbi:MAG: GAF domain-containing protein [Chloroflexi bacterium]|nr:GAF domain-containing protein [Chloroflexota bacterium]
MSSIHPVILGALILLLGALFYALTRLLAARLPSRKPQSLSPAPPPIPIELSQHSEAVLLVQPGGRIAYINAEARQWFKVWEEGPNLERLSRRTRPSEAFLNLCAAEGKTNFLLDGRTVAGVSYFVPYPGGRLMLVALRRPQFLVEKDGETAAKSAAPGGQDLSVFAEINRAITASLDIETTLRSILESVERLIPADFYEITQWDVENRLLIPYRLGRGADGAAHLERSAETYQPPLGYSGYLATQRKSLLVADVDAFRQARPNLDRRHFPIQSYIGAPLQVNGELVGTLELASLTKEAFDEDDLDLLLTISRQAAIALHNARAFAGQQRRARELSGLAQLAQSFTAQGGKERSGRDEQKDLFGNLVGSIAPLLDVEILGFLIYDDARHTLQGQLPFLGLHSDIIEWTRLSLSPGSPAEQVWLAQETLVCADAARDERVLALGLADLAQAAGIRHMALAPLYSGGRVLGYLLAAQKRSGDAFDQENLRLLSIVAAQAAAAIDNAGLIEQSRLRAQRAETLRRIASLTGSSATLDEILKYSLLDLVRLQHADHAAIFLLDEGRGELRLHRPSLYGVDAELAQRLGRLPIDDPQFDLTITGSKQPYLGANVLEDPRVLPLYRPLATALGVRSAVVAPLIAREKGIGEVMLGSRSAGHFSRADVQSLVTAASQLSGAIERAQLYSQTDDSLRRRVEQLTALTRVSRELNTTLVFEQLLERIYSELLRTTGAECGTLLLFQLPETGLELPAEPQVSLFLGDPPAAALHPLERAVLDSGATLIVQDFERAEDGEAQHTPAHEGVRSAMIVPIAYQEQVAGLIHLHARAPGRFDEAAQEIAETLAIQAAIALGNAQRYREQLRRSELLNRRVETLAKLFETSQSMQLELPLDQALENIAYAIQDATPFNVVVISVFDAQEGCLRRVAGAGLTLAEMEELRAHNQSWQSVAQALKAEFRVGRSYFIPYEQMPVTPEGMHTLVVMPWEGRPSESEHPENAWHPEDMLIAPLLDAQGEPLGLISVDAPRDDLRPDRPTIETLEIFGSQASLVIESQLKLQLLTDRLAAAQNELRLNAQAADDARSHLPLLLHKDLEQTLSLQRVQQRLQRARAGLTIAETANRQADREGVLQAVGREMLAQLDMDAAVIVEPSAHGPRLVRLLGSTASEANIEALLGQKNPLLACLQNGALLLETKLDGNWNDSPLLQALEARGFICLAVQTPAGVDSAVLAVSRAPLPPFTPEDEQIFAQLAQQIAATLQNLQLLTQTSQNLAEVNLLLEFNRQLGGLDQASLMRMLAEGAIQVAPSAQACMVALWDSARQALIPQSAVGYTDNARLMEMAYQSGEALPGQVFASAHAVILDEVDFAKEYNLPSENLLRYRDATGGRLPISCLALPIQQNLRAAPLGVLIMDNYQTTGAFSPAARQLVAALTQQTALNLENARLYQAAEVRARQLQALTAAAATLTSKLQPEELIAALLEQLAAILPYDTGTLWLRQNRLMVVRAAEGFADSDQRVGLTAAIEDSVLLSEMIATGQPISVGDVREDARFPALLMAQYFSWLGLPLIASGEVIGVIALEKLEANYYKPEHIQIGAAYTAQAAVALENARLFQESIARSEQLDQRSQRLEMLNRLSAQLSASLEVNPILQAAIAELGQALPENQVAAVTFSAGGRPLLQAETRSGERSLPLELPDAPIFERLRQTLGIFNAEEADQEVELAPLAAFLAERAARSILISTLATGQEAHGVLIVHSDRAHRFSPEEVGLARTISNQASIAIQNARLYAETRTLSQELEQRVVERTAQLEKAHRRTETLLKIITELTTSLDLEQVLNRALHLVNKIVEAGQISVLIARPGERQLHRLASIGYAGSVGIGGKTTPFTTDQGLAGWVIESRQAALIDNVLEDPRWILLAETPSPHHHSAMAVPLMVGAETLGVLMLYHQDVGHFSEDQLDLVQAAANQIAVSINNAELYRLIRDQAEDLGNMFRRQQVEASRSRAILEAVADGVLVTDAAKNVTLFNASAEVILEMDRGGMIGKSLDTFTGLFGGAAQAWIETINTWSQNPASYQPGELYAEQITLEDGRVVSVHLSPVILRDSFLGTVSTFRDITHQVELDRLKSEFVATVSHELRTPMTSIKGYVELMLMGAAGGMSEQQTHFLTIVKNNTERLAVLVNDLLDISRIESGRVTLSMQPLNLGDLAQQAIGDLQRRAAEEEKPMNIELAASASLPRAFGDPDRVRQIMDNLLENAYYYTPPNGLVRMSLFQSGAELQIDVQDNGIGIPQEVQPRVFERFYRGEHPFVLATSGTGLGLSIVQHLVEMHKGRIWFTSDGVPGEGSLFSFTLPLYQGQAA